MESAAFPGLSDGARLWIYGFSKTLTSPEAEVVKAHLSGFVASWTSHDQVVRGAFNLVHKQFAVLAAESPDAVSGCSIDKSVAVFKALKSLGIEALDRGLVFYRDGGSIRTCNRSEFALLAASSAVGATTVVFDLTLQTVGEYRAGRFETALEQSWHAKAFAVAHP